MKARLIAFLLFSFALVTAPVHVLAAADYFLKIDGVEGESTAKGREGQIEINGFTLAMSTPPPTGGSGGATGGPFKIQDIAITKAMDKSSPRLMALCATGDSAPNVELILTRPDPKGTGNPVVYLKITLTEVHVTSYQTGGSSGSPIPVDSFSLNFETIKVEYTPFDAVSKDPQPPVKFEYSLVDATTT